MAAALMTMTQCKKQETMPVTPATDTVKMTITAGPGRTDINTSTGAITWSKGDKLYVSDGTSWLGSLTLVGAGGSAQGTFEGSISGIGEGVTTCHFFYLGHDNGMAEPTGTYAASISFAAQDGTIGGATKFHTGYGNTKVTVAEGEAAGYVLMNTKIAIAHINLTKDATDYTDAVMMTGVSNTLSVTPGGIFSGSGEGGITIGNGNGTSGERYVTLIPATTPIVSVTFMGGVTGSMNFLAGIHENNFYGMKDAIAVTLETASAPKFRVDTDKTVEFSKGNLYWSNNDKKFHFEENQWSFANTWNTSQVSHFYWSKTASVAYNSYYYEESPSDKDVFFTNTTTTTANTSFQVEGELAGTWRTLSREEWNYLLGTRSGNKFAKAKVNDVKGLLIFPDSYNNEKAISGITGISDGSGSYPTDNILETTWTLMERSGVVFLPYVGMREVSIVSPYPVEINMSGNGYWSSSCSSNTHAYRVSFGESSTSDIERSYGYAVRLVRD